MPIVEKYILRHVGGNVNGMVPINNDKGMTAMAVNLKGLQAGSLSMIETNAEWKHFQYRETTNQILRKTFGGARVEFCTSDVSFEGRYKPGGTATAALGNWSHRVVGSGRDPTGCGRWSYVTYGGKGSKLITYVSVYRVCNKTNPGDTTAWRQQYQIKHSDESARVGSIDPHRQTMVDLETLSESYVTKDMKWWSFWTRTKTIQDAIDHKLTTGNSNQTLALTLTELSMGL
jgi:hypothetical protein